MKDLISKINKLDKFYSEKIFNLRIKNPMVTKLVKFITRIYGIVPLFLIALITSNNILITIATFVLIVILNSLLVEDYLKKTVKRERPEFLDVKLSTYSFPSTHSSTIAMATFHLFASSFLYNLNLFSVIVILVWGILVILSRVVYGHHHIFDVLAGILVGIILYLPLLSTLKA